MKRILAIILGVVMCMSSLVACDKPKEEPEDEMDWSESGDGWEQLFKDRKFAEGLGMGWIYGTTFSGNGMLKKGTPLTYRDIGKPINILPYGKATLDDNVTTSGHDTKTYWELEEGAKKDITDENGTYINELHDFRLGVNGKVTSNTSSLLQYEQYNDYLYETYGGLYPSNPKFVKSLKSNKNGKLTTAYNSYNEISNRAYAYSSEFSNNTWPHLYIHQNFREEIDLAKYKSLEYQVKMKVTKANQINTWPDGESDRYDQPQVPASSPKSPSEASLQGTFFFRKKGNAGGGFFVGMNYFSTRPSNQDEIFNKDQHGQAFYRIGTTEEQGEFYDLEGEMMEVGNEVTVKYNLYKMLNYVLIRKLETDKPKIIINGQEVDNFWYKVKPDDLTLSFYQVGWENIGNWDCEFEMSNLSLKAFAK